MELFVGLNNPFEDTSRINDKEEIDEMTRIDDSDNSDDRQHSTATSSPIAYLQMRLVKPRMEGF